jgi:hypothetical protein
MILFEDFLTDPEAYARSDEFWQVLLAPIAAFREWILPWFPQQSKLALQDRGTILTSWHPSSRKGFFLQQEAMVEAPWNFSAWTDVWDPDYSPVDVVHVHTVLAVSLIPRVLHLFELWSDPTMTRPNMNVTLEKSEEAGWPADWHDRFR